jgi:starch synthase
MKDSLKILFVSAECFPFAKTGGLGDVTGSLPRFLRKLGHSVIIVIPKYAFIDNKKHRITTVIESMHVPMGNESLICRVSRTNLAEDLPVYFIDYEPFFGRPGLYHDDAFNDYPDNPLRFTFLSRASLQLCYELQYFPDIVHANDWHTAVLPALLKRIHGDDPLFYSAASVLTIHNLAYQGRYDRSFYHYTGLKEEDFTSDKFECLNAVNFLKGGIYFADVVNTVSNGYAEETKTSAGGHGLDFALRNKGNDYVGILNGVDYAYWNPEHDTLIPANFSSRNIKGKYFCKRVLQKELDLRKDTKTPVIGIISRLIEQKGWYVLEECIEDIVINMDVQFAILGAGDIQLERFYGSLQQRYAGKIGSFIGYSNEMAHLIEAGSDLFLMPSLTEPCGLNQIYSLKYGTLPVVRATGGLDDTVENYDPATGNGTGFKFWESSAKAIYNTVGWALDAYRNKRSHFRKLMKKAMEQDFSWEESAGKYVQLYKRAIKNKNAG